MSPFMFSQQDLHLPSHNMLQSIVRRFTTTPVSKSNDEDLSSVLALNLLCLDKTDDLDRLNTVCEANDCLINIVNARRGNKAKTVDQLLGTDIAVLSWRWDLVKTPNTSVEESKTWKSKKIERFIQLAKLRKYKYAWCDFLTVPQHSMDKSLLMKHVRASRVLYEKCSVLVVDVDYVIPGVKCPSFEYMSRLWTTAEMSACLVNETVDFGTFCQIEKWCAPTISFAFNLRVTSLDEYDRLVQGYRMSFGALDSEITTASLGMPYSLCTIVQTNPPLLKKKFGDEKVGKFLQSFFRVVLVDQRHLTERPPLSILEQEALIQEYEANGRKSKLVNELVNTALQSTNGEMDPSFSFYNHYSAILLLAYEVVRYDTFASRRWNSRCYEEILRGLGELPTSIVDAAPSHVMLINDRKKLTFTFPGDDAAVKEMIIREHRLEPNPAMIDGVDLIRVPKYHELDITFAKTVHWKDLFTKLKFDPSACMVSISASYVEAIKAFTFGFFVANERGQVFASSTTSNGSPGDEATVSLRLNTEQAANVFKKTMGGYTLANGELFVIVTIMSQFGGASFAQCTYNRPVGGLSPENAGRLFDAVENMQRDTNVTQENCAARNKELEETVKRLPGIKVQEWPKTE